MTEIELIVPSKDMLPVTKLLADQGIFHQADASYLNSQTGMESTDSMREQTGAYASLERRIQSNMQTLGMDEGTPEKDEKYPMLEIDTARQIVDEIEQDVKRVNSQLSEHRKKLDQYQNYINQLEPINDTDFDIGFLQHSRYVYSMLGVVPEREPGTNANKSLPDSQRFDPSSERSPECSCVAGRVPSKRGYPGPGRQECLSQSVGIT